VFGSRRRALQRIVLPLGLLAVAPLMVGWRWIGLEWRDWHYNYPAKPSGYDQIVNRFGQPCSSNARAISMPWPAADNGVTYTVVFHKKLGGHPTEVVTDKGGSSTNLDNDVYGHIQSLHLLQYVKSGIFGYACRTKRTDSSAWSTHAWGIAIDLSSAYEPLGQCTSTTNFNFSSIFKDHGWTWGKSWCDPMHFQYASDY